MIVKKISKQASEMYLEGKSIETIASELDVCYRTARKAVWAEGVELRDSSTRLKGRTARKRFLVNRTEIIWVAVASLGSGVLAIVSALLDKNLLTLAFGFNAVSLALLSIREN